MAVMRMYESVVVPALLFTGLAQIYRLNRRLQIGDAHIVVAVGALAVVADAFVGADGRVRDDAFLSVVALF